MSKLNLVSYPILPSGTVVANYVKQPGGSVDSLQLLPTVDGTTVDAAFAILSDDGALLIPCVTTAQRNALIAKVGMIVYNIDTDTYDAFNSNDTWVAFGEQSGGPIIASKVSLSDGTRALPSLTFVSDSDLGLYRPSAGVLGIASDAVSLTPTSGSSTPNILRFYNAANTHYIGLFCTNGQASDVEFSLPAEFPLRAGNPITCGLFGNLTFGDIVSAAEFRMWNDDNSSFTGLRVNGSSGNIFYFPTTQPALNGSAMVCDTDTLSFSDVLQLRGLVFNNTGATHTTSIGIPGAQTTDLVYTIPDLGDDSQFLLEETIQQDTKTLSEMKLNKRYVVAAGLQSTLGLPHSSIPGTYVILTAADSFGWKVTQSGGQQIRMGNIFTTSGPTGYIESTSIGDCVKIVCQTEGDLWFVESSQGNPNLV